MASLMREVTGKLFISLFSYFPETMVKPFSLPRRKAKE